jgi:M6 family metalloprotease-like protein
MNPKKAVFGFFIISIFLGLLFCPTSQGSYLKDVPVVVRQPNGVELKIYASGDEFYNYLHDKEGYTIIQDPQTGYYVYAVEAGGELFSSGFAVNEADSESLSLSKHLTRAVNLRSSPRAIFPGGSPANPQEILSAPKTGTINNIVIFIRFSGESEFTDAISTYSAMFNNSSSGTNSMYNYFMEVSYNQLTISTTFYPTPSTTVLSYQDSHTRGYYQPYNSVTNTIGYNTDAELQDREHTLLKNAVNNVSSQIPSSLVVDGDGDGNVDNVCFIVYGSPSGWNSLLWPHMWTLTSQTVYINSKRVYTYNLQLQTTLASSGAGVLSHEMFHSLGAPDLYHYSTCSSNTALSPVSQWDIMESDLNPPQHMGAYMKKRYGTWISSIPEITTSGTYTLYPLTSSTGNAYKVSSPNSTTEYFLVEYRKKTGTFESSLPGSGLLVYRINTAQDGQGNSCGPPDEVYIYRPGGTVSNNGTPDSANFNSEVGRTAINDSTDPSSFLSTGSTGGLNVSAIGSAGETISFTVNITGSGTGIVQTITPPTSTTVSPGGTLGPFSVTTTNNTGSSYSFYAYPYINTPDGTWHRMFTNYATIPSGTTNTISGIYIGVPGNAQAGAHYHQINLYDTSWNLIDYDGFSFTVTSATTSQYLNNDKKAQEIMSLPGAEVIGNDGWKMILTRDE